MIDSSRYAVLTEFGKKLSNRPSLEDGLILIADAAKELLGAKRCSIYVYDATHNQLWTTLADGIQKIVLPANEGLAGHTIKEKKPIISNDPYNDPRFFKDIDQKSGFVTNNIATAPVFSSQRKVIGVLQLLNKDEGFTNEDSKFMIFFAHYISSYLELASMYGEINE